MSRLQKRMRPLLGCFVEIALPAMAAQSAFDAAFARIELVQNLLSFHNLSSDLSRLNCAQGKSVSCHPLTIQCLRLARAVTRISQNRFNCTLGGSLTASHHLPAHNFHLLYAEQLLPYGCWQDIEINAQNVYLRRPVLITLDGIAKGFAIDCAVKELKREKISTGWINAGGDIRVFGEWVLPVAIRDHHGAEHFMGGLQNAALATSTSIASSEFPGMLLDAVGNSLPPMTSAVISSSAWRADALTKVAASTPLLQRTEYLASLGGRWVAV